MRRTEPVLGLLVLAVLLGARAATAAPPRPSPPPELKRLRVLLVLDTNSDLGWQEEVNEDRVRQVLEMNVPAKLLEIKRLRGRDATREKVLAHYRGLKTGPDEALLFYYGGRGGLDPKTRQESFHLEGGKGKPLFRWEVHNALKAKKPGLVVLISDCASRPFHLYRGSRITASAPAQRTSPVFRNLFFQARGVVDITSAAPGTLGWGDGFMGGIFTRSLCRLLRQKPAELDTNRDGFVSWKEFFPLLQKDTQAIFNTWKKDATDRGEEVDAQGQKPHAFALPSLPGAGGRVTGPTRRLR
jgi:hypothetical protein